MTESGEKLLKVLVIGTLPPPLGGGGASVLLECLVEDLKKRNDVDLRVVDTLGVRFKKVGPAIRKFIRILWGVMTGVRKADVVSLHAAPTGLPLIGPIVCFWVCFWRKPFIVRKFGGIDYIEFDAFRRFWANWVVRHADLYLVESKGLMQAAKARGLDQVEWYPNNRPVENCLTVEPKARQCRRFVFISQIRLEKGIREIIAAGERLGEEVVIDVYGPFLDGLNADIFKECRRVHYHGILKHDEVMNTLHQYDALLLPTYHRGEGYPGIVLEAYRARLPVISTNWKYVPEIVDETSGMLVEPRDAEALYQAMKRLVEDDTLYARLVGGVREKQQLFDTAVWVDRFVEFCQAVYKKHV